MARSIVENQTVSRTLAPAARTVTANGTAVQTGADAYARAAVLDIGAWTDGTHIFKFQSSPDNSTWTNLTVADIGDPDGALDSGLASTDVAIITVDGATDDDVIHQLDLLTIAEYVRAVVTISGSPSTGLLAGVTIVTGHPKRFAGDSNPMSAGGAYWT